MREITGEKDKNGIVVCDGDILRGKSIDGYSCNYVVKWSNYRRGFVGECPTEAYDIAPTKFSECEIIGNIHEAGDTK